MDSIYYLAGLCGAALRCSCQTFLHPRKPGVARAPALWHGDYLVMYIHVSLHAFEVISILTEWYGKGWEVFCSITNVEKWKQHQNSRLSTFPNWGKPRWGNCFRHSKDLSQHPISWARRLKEPSWPFVFDWSEDNRSRGNRRLATVLTGAGSFSAVCRNKDINSALPCAEGGNVYPKWAFALRVLIALCCFSHRWWLTFVWFRGTLKVCPWWVVFFPVYLYDGQLKLCWGRWETPAA